MNMISKHLQGDLKREMERMRSGSTLKVKRKKRGRSMNNLQVIQQINNKPMDNSTSNKDRVLSLIENIEENKDFVVHIAHREMAPLVTQTSATLPRGDSEIDKSGLKVCEFPGSRLPRLADCRIAYACRLHDLQEIGHAPQALVFGEVTQVYIDDAVIEHDARGRMQIMAEKVDPIGRLGGGEYTTFGKIINIPRPA